MEKVLVTLGEFPTEIAGALGLEELIAGATLETIGEELELLFDPPSFEVELESKEPEKFEFGDPLIAIEGVSGFPGEL
jgi:hypothetical protein